MPEITFLPEEKRMKVKEGSEFVTFADEESFPIRFGCKIGNCGVCAIQVEKGMENLTKMDSHEKETILLKDLDPETHRLACQCAINGNIEIYCLNRKKNP
jgi:ferredoxin